MERINFDAEFVEKIINGEKITTVRRGIKSYPVGRIVELTQTERDSPLQR